MEQVLQDARGSSRSGSPVLALMDGADAVVSSHPSSSSKRPLVSPASGIVHKGNELSRFGVLSLSYRILSSVFPFIALTKDTHLRGRTVSAVRGAGETWSVVTSKLHELAMGCVALPPIVTSVIATGHEVTHIAFL